MLFARNLILPRINSLELVNFLSSCHYLLNKYQVSKVFSEKTVPTSLAISMLVWGVSTSRVSTELYQRCSDMLGDIIAIAAKTGEFQLTVFPEYLQRALLSDYFKLKFKQLHTLSTF